MIQSVLEVYLMIQCVYRQLLLVKVLEMKFLTTEIIVGSHSIDFGEECLEGLS